MVGLWGHRVHGERTGASALESARRKPLDLILLDIKLPDIMGYDLIPQFKKYQPGINIITMTGYNTPELERKIRGCGITYYLAKPVQMEELKSILDHIDKKYLTNKGESKA
jgi:YesN/AraC family two-component response regulator